MQVILAGQILADYGNMLSAQDLDGNCLVQQTDIIRAVTKLIQYRGNELITFNFTVTLQFANQASAELFYVAYWSSLTKQGVLTINCGFDATDPDLTVAQ